MSVRVRPAYPGDAALLQEMHERLSTASVELRYLRPYQPKLEDSQCVSQLDKDEGAAYVAVVEAPSETIVGYAYYVLAPGSLTAEPAIVVEDRFQGQGIGRMLAERLYQRALEQHIVAFDALIHPSNDTVMYLIRRLGLPFKSQFAYGLREVRIWLDPARRWAA
jgi:GNAT superfamily N-acetyltransferase